MTGDGTPELPGRDPAAVHEGEPSAGSPPVVREVVRRDPTRSSGLRPVRELAERTTVGDAYLRSLIRTQLLLSFRLLAVVLVVLVGVPVMLLVEPRLRTTRFAGVPVGWIVIGALFYPLFIALAAAFVRRAERNEADFVELVTGRQPGKPTRP